MYITKWLLLIPQQLYPTMYLTRQLLLNIWFNRSVMLVIKRQQLKLFSLIGLVLMLQIFGAKVYLIFTVKCHSMDFGLIQMKLQEIVMENALRQSHPPKRCKSMTRNSSSLRRLSKQETNSLTTLGIQTGLTKMKLVHTIFHSSPDTKTSMSRPFLSTELIKLQEMQLSETPLPSHRKLTSTTCSDTWKVN